MGHTELEAAFYPLYITHFLMGYVPFKPDKANATTGKIYNGVTMAVILLLTVTYGVYRHLNLVNHPDLEDNTLMKFINVMYFSTVLGFTLASYCWSAIQRNSSLKLWTNIAEIDKDIKLVGIRPNYSYIIWSSVRFLVCCLISLHIYLLYLLFSQEFYDVIQASISYGLMYLGAPNHTAVICSFLTLLRFVSYILDTIIRKTESILSHQDAHLVPKMKKIMVVYNNLYVISKLINQAFSLQLLLSFAISFVLLTFQSYNMICSLYNQSPYLKYAFAGILFVMMGVFEKFVIVWTCHKCAKQTEALKLLLNRHMAAYSTNKNVYKELNAFALQLLHETFEIYAGNMFLIDLPIFTSVCGTATTYIILLWQTDSGVDLNYSMKKVFGVF